MSPRSDAWHERAACTRVDPELFFVSGPGKRKDWTPARRVCFDCPVVDHCLAEAHATHDYEGMRAGLTPDELHALRPRRTA